MGDNLKVPCEVYSRIVGYLRPVDSWNAGKQQEFADRVDYGSGELPKPDKEVESDECEV